MYDLWYAGDEKQASLYTIPASTHGTMASEISMRHSLRGSSHVLSTGCTSSTDAIGHAFLNIRFGRLDRTLAGGSDAPFAPGIFTAFSVMKIMTSSWNEAPERGSRPFSSDRDGFVLAEGAWMFLLEERDARPRARRAHLRRDPRLRLDLRGLSPRAPRGGRRRAGARDELAIEDARIGPAEIDYVNLHGTSTVLNDRIETRALKLALGPARARSPRAASSR